MNTRNIGKQVDRLYRAYCEAQGDTYDGPFPPCEYVETLHTHAATFMRFRTNWDEGGYSDEIVEVDRNGKVKSIVGYFDTSTMVIYNREA